MMRLAIFGAILVSGLTYASMAPAQSLVEACGKDLTTFCSKVTPGDGRIASCLYAHSDQIEDSCVGAIEDVALQMEWMSNRIEYALDQCSADINQFCAKTKLGDGRIFSCLMEKKPELTQPCSKIIERVEERLR